MRWTSESQRLNTMSSRPNVAAAAVERAIEGDAKPPSSPYTARTTKVASTSRPPIRDLQRLSRQ